VDKRFFLTLLLCFGIFVLWTAVLQPLLWPAPKRPPAPPAGPTPPAPPATPVAPPLPAVEAQVLPPITIETRRFIATFRNQGAVLDELRVKADADAVRLLEPTRTRVGSFYIEGLGHPWEVVGRTPSTIRFRTRAGDFEYEKHFTLADGEGDKDSGRHVFRVAVRIANVSEKPLFARFVMFPFNGIDRQSDYRYDSYLSGFWGVEGKGGLAIEWYWWSDTHKEAAKPQAGRMAAGIKNRYFALALMPDNPARVLRYEPQGMGDAELKEAGGFRNIKLRLESTSTQLDPAKATDYVFDVYAGPVRKRDLQEAPRNLAALVDYYGPDFLGDIVLAILNFFYGIVGSYGFAIVFTTLAIRVALFWINKKSQVSMFKMSQIQPKIAIIKEKYKDNPQKLNEEQWKLFREEKINPLAGCLPVILQLFIFGGMYSVLDTAVDLRGHGFLWFSDLSEPDRLIPFGRPLFLGVDSFNLLPILFTIVWVIQSMMAPKSNDPQMQMNQKMMQIMPIVFGVMCYSLAAGLSWYFLISALLGIVESKLIKKLYLPAPPVPAAAGGKTR
jgi:YidC/Oxa1 family membrane protein insertase